MNGVFPDGMFDRINYPWFAPTADEMKKEAEDMLKPRKVEFDRFYSETYDLSNETSKQKYLKDFTEVLTGIKLKTHFIFNREKQFIEKPIPKWIMLMEWAVFKLIEVNTPTLNTPNPANGTPDLVTEKERKLPDGLEDLT